MKLKPWLVALMVVVVAVSGASVAVAQEDGAPGEPVSFYGDVQDAAGVDAPSGTTVYAVVNGSVEDTITVQTAGTYGGSGATDDKLRVDSNAGEKVRFHIGSPDGPQSKSTYALEPGVYEEDLIFPAGAFEDGDDGTDNGDDGTDDGDDGTDDSDGSTDDGDDGTDDGDDGDDNDTGSTGGADDGETQVDPPEPPANVEVVADETAELEVDQDTGRTTATFGEDNSVESVSFEGEQTGTVNARTLSAAPEETGPAPGSAATVAQINVGDALADNPATIRKRVTRDRLSELGADAEDLTALRFAGGEWQPLETEVADENDQRVVLEFETSGFSYFAVSATGEPTAAIDAPSEVDAGTEVTLDASGSSTEYGEIASYDWSVDGESLSGETATTTLDEAGDVSVELTVTNDAGETDTASATITVAQTDDGDGTDGADGTDGDDTGTDDGIPGFGPLVALVALVAAALLATRRND